MESRFYHAYRGELQFLREMGAEFAAKHPKIASRLVLGEEDHPDPHVERLLEGVAFLTARVHNRIDDDFTEISTALLSTLYPHYLRPLPSMAIVQFELAPEQGKLTSGFPIPRGATLRSKPVEGYPCTFRTCYSTTLWPVAVSSAGWSPSGSLESPVRGYSSAPAIHIGLRSQGSTPLSALGIPALRFYLDGDADAIAVVYEILISKCFRILVRDASRPELAPVELPPDSLRAVGFEEDEAVLPYPQRSFPGYRLLQEYFAYPRKFQFIEIGNLARAFESFGAAPELQLLLLLESFERRDRSEVLQRHVSPALLRLGCTPAINLFQQTAEPILLRHTDYEYRIVADARRRHTEIFSVDSVVGCTPESPAIIPYAPCFSSRYDERSSSGLYWHAVRKPAPWKQAGGADVFLQLLDASGRPLKLEVEALTARLTCSNGDLPARLPFGNRAGDFELPGGGPIRPVVALERLTPSYPPPAGEDAAWRLISHLSLNHLSLVSEGRAALQEILRLYDFTNSGASAHHIQAIRAVESHPQVARVTSEYGISFARGTRVELELDDTQFAGAAAYLFANVLERFLAMYASLNSFSRLVVRTPQRKEALWQWQPRAGRKILM